MAKSSPKWFKPVRGSYLPSSWQGWLLYVVLIAYMVASAYIVCRHTMSLPYIAIQVFVQWVVAGIVMTWIAQHTS